MTAGCFSWENKMLILDIECYTDFFLVKLLDPATGSFRDFPIYEGCSFDIHGLRSSLVGHEVYTFNGNHYDMPILSYALAGATNSQLKAASDAIIVGGLKPWEFYREYGGERLYDINHVDLSEVAPGVRIGLKMYAARCHAERIQDLPFDPKELVSPAKRVTLSTYCANDLRCTDTLRSQLQDQLELRVMLGSKYGIDLRSKSDAQIAEAVIRNRVLDARPEMQGHIEPRYIPHGYSFKYFPPNYIGFQSQSLSDLLDEVRELPFLVSDKEEAIITGRYDESVRTGVVIPAELKGRDITIGKGTYRIGIGGLHSQESDVSHVADENTTIVDFDVTSYYPSLILNMGMYPSQLGPVFLSIYRDIYESRLEAKRQRRKVEADSLKIVLNGTFGKLFSKYSALYAPEFGIATTMTGQLCLLMLIEQLEAAGIEVTSANTDGVTTKMPRSMLATAESIVKAWELRTGLAMEKVEYAKVYSRDVNNYVAFPVDGEPKRKGVFRKSGVLENKHPDKDICADAVVAFLRDGTPLETTIKACHDLRKFVCVRSVKGGGINKASGEYLGRAVRWYYSAGSADCIVDGKSGNLVAGSQGCTPVMVMPGSFPDDVDYHAYETVAIGMLGTMGIDVYYWINAESNRLLATIGTLMPYPQWVNITRARYLKLLDMEKCE